VVAVEAPITGIVVAQVVDVVAAAAAGADVAAGAVEVVDTLSR
jgi:hypothetical protein